MDEEMVLSFLLSYRQIDVDAKTIDDLFTRAIGKWYKPNMMELLRSFPDNQHVFTITTLSLIAARPDALEFLLSQGWKLTIHIVEFFLRNIVNNEEIYDVVIVESLCLILQYQPIPSTIIQNTIARLDKIINVDVSRFIRLLRVYNNTLSD